MVDGARFSRRAISRTPCRCARQMAISSRSANDRERPDSGFADGARWDGGMPPALRNQRAPTAGDTPAPTAASSLEHPAAMAAQNRWRSSRRATEGRPGEGKAPRPARSERRFRTVIATSSLKVLRRPLEAGHDLRAPMLPHEIGQRACVSGTEPDAAMTGRTTELPDGVGAVDRKPAFEKQSMRHGRIVIFARIPLALHPLDVVAPRWGLIALTRRGHRP